MPLVLCLYPKDSPTNIFQYFSEWIDYFSEFICVFVFCVVFFLIVVIYVTGVVFCVPFLGGRSFLALDWNVPE